MKFLFGDKVKVVCGFYQGIIGHVTDYKKFLMENSYNDYYVEGVRIMPYWFKHVNAWINEKELVKLED